jgi:hypothetical protein
MCGCGIATVVVKQGPGTFAQGLTLYFPSKGRAHG